MAASPERAPFGRVAGPALRTALADSAAILVTGPPFSGKSSAILATFPGAVRVDTLPAQVLGTPQSSLTWVELPTALASPTNDFEGFERNARETLRTWGQRVAELIQHSRASGKVILEARRSIARAISETTGLNFPSTSDRVSGWLKGLVNRRLEHPGQVTAFQYVTTRTDMIDLIRHRRDQGGESQGRGEISVKPLSDREELVLQACKEVPTIFSDSYIPGLLPRVERLTETDLREEVNRLRRHKSVLVNSSKSGGSFLGTGVAGSMIIGGPGGAVLERSIPALAGAVSSFALPLVGVGAILAELWLRETQTAKDPISALIEMRALWSEWAGLPERQALVLDSFDAKLGLVPGFAGLALGLFFGTSEDKFRDTLAEYRNDLIHLNEEVSALSRRVESLLKDFDSEVRGISHSAEQLGFSLEEDKVWIRPGITGGQSVGLVPDESAEELMSRIGAGIAARKLIVLRGTKGLGKSVLARIALARNLSSGDPHPVLDVRVAGQQPGVRLHIEDLIEAHDPVLFYDPIGPELYKESLIAGGPGLEFASDPTRDQPAMVVRSILGWHKIFRSPALLVIPDDYFHARVEPVLPAALDIESMELPPRSDSFIERIITTYARGTSPDDATKRLAHQIAEFREGNTLVAACTGRLLRSGQVASDVETILDRARGDAIRLIRYYLPIVVLGGGRELGAEDISALAVPVIFHCDFGPLPLPLVRNGARLIERVSKMQLLTSMQPEPPRPDFLTAFRFAFFSTFDLDDPVIESSTARWLAAEHEELVERALSGIVSDGRSPDYAIQPELAEGPLVDAIRKVDTAWKVIGTSSETASLLNLQLLTAICVNSVTVIRNRDLPRNQAVRDLPAIEEVLVLSACVIAGFSPRSFGFNPRDLLRQVLFEGELPPPAVARVLVGVPPFLPPIALLLSLPHESCLEQLKAQLDSLKGGRAEALDYVRALAWTIGTFWSSDSHTDDELEAEVTGLAIASEGLTSACESICSLVGTYVVCLAATHATKATEDRGARGLASALASYFWTLRYSSWQPGEEPKCLLPLARRINLTDPVATLPLVSVAEDLAGKTDDWASVLQCSVAALAIVGQNAKAGEIASKGRARVAEISPSREVRALAAVVLNLSHLERAGKSLTDVDRARLLQEIASELQLLRGQADRTPLLAWVERTEPALKRDRIVEEWLGTQSVRAKLVLGAFLFANGRHTDALAAYHSATSTAESMGKRAIELERWEAVIRFAIGPITPELRSKLQTLWTDIRFDIEAPFRNKVIYYANFLCVASDEDLKVGIGARRWISALESDSRLGLLTFGLLACRGFAFRREFQAAMDARVLSSLDSAQRVMFRFVESDMDLDGARALVERLPPGDRPATLEKIGVIASAQENKWQALGRVLGCPELPLDELEVLGTVTPRGRVIDGCLSTELLGICALLYKSFLDSGAAAFFRHLNILGKRYHFANTKLAPVIDRALATPPGLWTTDAALGFLTQISIALNE